MELEKIIKKSIQAQKYIGFDEFVNEALYNTKYGYYRSNNHTIGKSGDFITAPETSDLFGFTLAKQIIEIGDNILEFGAGNGVMAAQILCYLESVNKLPDKYYIIELSASLKQQQQKNIFKILPHLKSTLVWLTELPSNFSGTVLANEVLDAMPFKRGIIKSNYFYELGVYLENDNFAWKMLNNKIDEKKYDLADGYISEFNLQSLAWIQTIYQKLDKAVVLLIDYGFSEQEFFHTDRFMGTLRCYKNHKADDNPFVDIGTKDITSWVNFSRVANCAKDSGFEVLGYTTQAMFLISLGIEKFITAATDKEKIKLATEIKQLVFPNAMGESFKVLALSKNKSIKLSGFKEQNLRARL